MTAEIAEAMDLLVCKFGQNFDYIEIEANCGYVVETVEPFLDLGVEKSNKVSKQKLSFKDDEGRVYNERISDIVKSGLKVYYHDKPRQFDVDKYPGTRAPGMMQSLLDEIEVVVAVNNLS